MQIIFRRSLLAATGTYVIINADYCELRKASIAVYKQPLPVLTTRKFKCLNDIGLTARADFL